MLELGGNNIHAGLLLDVQTMMKYRSTEKAIRQRALSPGKLAAIDRLASRAAAKRERRAEFDSRTGGAAGSSVQIFRLP